MGDRVTEFFSRLHAEHLKSRGYKKERYTFHRVLETHTERVQFQGSAWNTADSPWLFFVNFGVQFRDLPPRFPDRDLPRTHCWTRIEAILPEVPLDYGLTGRDDDLLKELAVHVEQAGARVAKDIDALRRRYQQTRSPHLSLK